MGFRLVGEPRTDAEHETALALERFADRLGDLLRQHRGARIQSLRDGERWEDDGGASIAPARCR
jgi:hypothetical protein